MAASLIVHRDGRKFEQMQQVELSPGARGNQQTLQMMAKIVREDAESPDLKRFARRTLFPGIEQKDQSEKIKIIYEFCRDGILYLDDTPNVERVADLWSCLYSLAEFAPVGDCVIKSTALATVLALFDFKPVFIASKIRDDAATFNHVFCGLETGNQLFHLDATPKRFQPPVMTSLYVYKIF
jgi:hypothetical protein